MKSLPTIEQVVASVPAHKREEFAAWVAKQPHGEHTLYDALARASVVDINVRLAKAPDHWYWCLHCERVCQAKEMREDFIGAMARCPHGDCDGCGIDVDMHRYHPRGTFFGGAKGPPAETLKSGQVVPLYPKKRKAKRAEQKR